MIIALVVIFAIVFTILIVLFLDTKDRFFDHKELVNNSHLIKFNTFYTMYCINPNAWNIGWCCIYHPTKEKSFYFHFNFIDFLKFEHFKKNLKKKEIFIVYNKEMTECIEFFKKDIANYECNANKEIKKMLKDIWEQKITD